MSSKEDLPSRLHWALTRVHQPKWLPKRDTPSLSLATVTTSSSHGPWAPLPDRESASSPWHGIPAFPNGEHVTHRHTCKPPAQRTTNLAVVPSGSPVATKLSPFVEMCHLVRVCPVANVVTIPQLAGLLFTQLQVFYFYASYIYFSPSHVPNFSARSLISTVPVCCVNECT